MTPTRSWSCNRTSLRWLPSGPPCAKRLASVPSSIGEVSSIDVHFPQGPKVVAWTLAGVPPTVHVDDHDERLAIERSTIRCKAFRLKGFSIRAFGTCARKRFADAVNAPPVMKTMRDS